MQSGIPFHGVTNPVQHFYSLLTKKNPVWQIQKIPMKNKVPKLPDSEEIYFLNCQIWLNPFVHATSPRKKGKEKKNPLILCRLEFHLNMRDTILKQEENLSCKNNLDNER
jgi:hypothetical protein